MIISSYKCGVILYDWVNRGSEKDYLKELSKKQKAMATRMAFEMILEIIPQLVFQLIFNLNRLSKCSKNKIIDYDELFAKN